MKLFVWENVLTDYSSGIMFALAPNVETAREMLYLVRWSKINPETAGWAARDRSCDRQFEEDLAKEPRVVEQAEAFVVWGGS